MKGKNKKKIMVVIGTILSMIGIAAVFLIFRIQKPERSFR